jgi:hypothetical protein
MSQKNTSPRPKLALGVALNFIASRPLGASQAQLAASESVPAPLRFPTPAGEDSRCLLWRRRLSAFDIGYAPLEGLDLLIFQPGFSEDRAVLRTPCRVCSGCLGGPLQRQPQILFEASQFYDLSWTEQRHVSGSEPTASAIPAAAAKQENNEDDDDECCCIHGLFSSNEVHGQSSMDATWQMVKAGHRKIAGAGSPLTRRSLT